jgi:uncharacterized protein (UPF0303 family)
MTIFKNHFATVCSRRKKNRDNPAKTQHDSADFARFGGIVLKNGGNLPAAAPVACYKLRP